MLLLFFYLIFRDGILYLYWYLREDKILITLANYRAS